MKRRSTPGRSTLTATGARPSGVAIVARCTCAIEAAATGGPNDSNSSSSGAPSAAAIDALGLGLRERRHPVLQRLEVARELDADHVRPRRQELAELHIGRPEQVSAVAKPRAAGAGCRAALKQPRQP